MTRAQEMQQFLATCEYDAVHAAWPGRRVLERIHAGGAALRTALTDSLHQRTKGLTLPSIDNIETLIRETGRLSTARQIREHTLWE